MDLSNEFYAQPSSSSGASTPSTAAPTDPSSSSSAGTTTSRPPTSSPTLDQELSAVYSSLGSLWGKVRKQSVSTLSAAQATAQKAQSDWTPLVVKARKEMERVAENTRSELKAGLAAVPQAREGEDGVVIGADGTPVVVSASRTTRLPGAAPLPEDKGKSRVPPSPSPSSSSPTTAAGSTEPAIDPTATASAFFRRLGEQNPKFASQLTALQASVQGQLDALPGSLERVQGTLKEAVEKAEKEAGVLQGKGVGWLEEARAGLVHIAKDAVRVVPPPGGAAAGGSGGKEEEKRGDPRMEAALKKLRSSTEVFERDPARPRLAGLGVVEASGAGGGAGAGEESAPKDDTEEEEDERESFSLFLQSIEDSGGLEGSSFLSRVERELTLYGADGLTSIRDELTGKGMSKETFWSRYFYQKDKVEKEEERRREVIERARAQAAEEGVGKEDEFSWDMEDDEEEPSAPALAPPSSTAPLAAPAVTPSSSSTLDRTPTLPSAPSPLSSPPVGSSSAPAERAPSKDSVTSHTSPRVSSDGTQGSYDLVGLKSGEPSEAGGNGSPVAKEDTGKKEDKKEDSEGDSDWE